MSNGRMEKKNQDLVNILREKRCKLILVAKKFNEPLKFENIIQKKIKINLEKRMRACS